MRNKQTYSEQGPIRTLKLDSRYRQEIKAPLPEHLTFAQALQHAEGDIRSNWHTYRDQF